MSRTELDAGPPVRPALGRALLDGVAPFGVLILGAILMVTFAVIAPSFLTSGNIASVLRDAALPTIVAVGLTLPLVMSEYDLSIGAVGSFSTMLGSVLISNAAIGLGFGFPLAIGAGVIIGLANGVLIAYIGLSALVVTIATASVVNGLEFVASPGQVYGSYPEGYVDFCRGDIFGIPSLIVMAAGVAVAFWFLLERTELGRHMKAVGGNREAARLVGIDVRRTVTLGFVICAASAALAGMLYAGKQAVAYPLTGLNVLLPSYAAAFIGAATFRLGEFNVFGTVVGVLIAAIASNGLLLMNVPPYAGYIFQGTILLVALVFARLVAGGRSAQI